MRGDTHLLAGVAVGVAAHLTDPVGWALLVAGSLLPDIDHHASPVGRWVPWVQTLCGHRRCWHSLLAIAGAGILNPWLGVGYAVHVALDLLTRSKVQLLWPMPGGYAAGLIRVGTAGELLVKGLLVTLIGACLF